MFLNLCGGSHHLSSAKTLRRERLRYFLPFYRYVCCCWAKKVQLAPKTFVLVGWEKPKQGFVNVFLNLCGGSHRSSSVKTLQREQLCYILDFIGTFVAVGLKKVQLAPMTFVLVGWEKPKQGFVNVFLNLCGDSHHLSSAKTLHMGSCAIFTPLSTRLLMVV